MKRRDILKALLVVPIVPITFVDSSIKNAELRVIVKEFRQAGYKVTKHKDTFGKTFYCLLDPNEIFKIPNPQSGFSNQSRLLEVGVFERIDKRFISEVKKENVECKIEDCSGYIVPKQSEIGTFIFGNLEGNLPKQFEHLFSYVEDW